jgi:hypothetical protein
LVTGALGTVVSGAVIVELINPLNVYFFFSKVKRLSEIVRASIGIPL